jgi:hypothetical protein
MSVVEIIEGCPAVFLAPGCQRGRYPGWLLGMPPPCSSLLSCKVFPCGVRYGWASLPYTLAYGL